MDKSPTVTRSELFLTQNKWSNLPLVCVQGLGFVGLAMATVVANAKTKEGRPQYRVVGVDLPERDGFYNTINQGQMPFTSEDESFPSELHRAVVETNNFLATPDTKFFASADIVVTDVNLSIEKKSPNDYFSFSLKDAPFRAAVRTLGQTIRPECLVLVETTVPPGFTSEVVLPILREEFLKRGIKSEPLVAHSYERVMPGRHYLSSIRAIHRTFSGTSSAAAERAKNFLSTIVDVEKFPLRQEAYPEASELAKVMENSFRAMNIAFIQEWTELADKMGVNLYSVVEGIRNRPTHKNIMNPGFGVGGYCLTKDSLLAQWSSDEFFHSDLGLPMSLEALKINDHMPLYTAKLIRERISLRGKSVGILGLSYREDVGDSRFSPTEIFYDEIKKDGATIKIHDTYLQSWIEKPEVKLSASKSAASAIAWFWRLAIRSICKPQIWNGFV